ncbi:polysaccharide biosynthesis/export family protein [Rhodovulum marinum]|uniref:Polysaccharide export outer membrane protein n=1 Tax=Rhodovulum marinum TaxID=320662 RepID=A0A4R2PVK1_9RHOB|nr:polysaccharide biosynthesis/export family protein [Rhodovulum marinum]TCP39274.1 polysaccharide export outer membrane protein [Rhodovulum marinum]
MNKCKTLVLGCGLLLAGCGGSGPSANAILSGTDMVVGRASLSETERAPYVLVEMDRGLARAFTDAQRRTEQEAFHRTGGPMPVVIGRGDIVQVAIVSTAETGFVDFTTASISPISQTSLVPQEVGDDGMIRVPPLGRIRAQGRTVREVENFLTERLGEVLVEPAAIVRIADRQSAKVSVVGKVGAPGKYSLDDVNLRVLDLITAAGGPAERSENLRVKLSRNGVTRTALLESILSNPRLNVYLRPGDVIEVETPENRIVVLGAGGTRNQTLTLDQPDGTLVDVLGYGEGLANRRADRSGVFIYRDAQRDVLARMGVDVSRFAGDSVPTVFRFDLSQPDSLFVAKSFAVADGDVLYIAASLKDAVDAFATFFPVPSTFVPTPSGFDY